MISWAATLSSTKLALLVKVVAEEAVAVLVAVAGVVVTAEAVVAEAAEAVVVAEAAVAAVVAVIAVTAAVVVAETGAGNRFTQLSKFDLRNGEPRRSPFFYFLTSSLRFPRPLVGNLHFVARVFRPGG
jgi:hypothetical protein